MKRISAFLSSALVLMLMLTALAEKPNQPGENAYRNAKEAVSLISYGEYAMALQKLSLTNEYSADSLKKFIDGNCREIYRGSVQTDVSVAWYDGKENIWRLAVPFEAPDDDAVGALVFSLNPPEAFKEIAFMRWADVKMGYAASGEVYWNVEYVPGYVIVGDW
ncbi:MAG: hypothetical protein IJC48_02305 [Clostridia bacterium]|nr:hypothetical protein [Clostridia bacterium]